MFEGIVLKVTSEYSIVKTKSEYLKVHTKTLMEPGQRIYFTKEDIIQTPTIKKKSAPYLLRYGAAAALLYFFFLLRCWRKRAYTRQNFLWKSIPAFSSIFPRKVL